MSQQFALASEFKSDFDLEKLEIMVAKESLELHKEIEEREGIDKLWMLQVIKTVHDGEQVNNDDLKRVWEIYRTKNNHRIDDKLMAFRLIAEIEDISKWQNEFDAFAYSNDPNFVKTAIQTIQWKLYQGSEREKIILSNNTSTLEHLIQFAENNKSDTTIDRETFKLMELTKSYSGKNPPAAIQRPGRRPSAAQSGEGRISDGKTLDSSSRSWVKKIGKVGNLILLGFIGIFIITTILIWRRKSNPTS